MLQQKKLDVPSQQYVVIRFRVDYLLRSFQVDQKILKPNRRIGIPVVNAAQKGSEDCQNLRTA